MENKKINLEKLIKNLGENIMPNIEYFMNEAYGHSDGNVDGSNDELYKGLVHGEGIDELEIDKNILNSENPILELCKIILRKGGTLFFKLGLLYSENFEEIEIDNEEWLELDEYCEGKYSTGGYGIFLTEKDWDYGYYDHIFFLCFVPPEEKFHHLDYDEKDKVAMRIIKNIEEMDIFD